ncbi:hypothetical protein SPHINGOR109_10733 [Sphingorhabdus sp. 109]|nr:hypothetical protein SPHINGOR109_10733 [Sphingorhabdus sp. 109]
MDQPAGKSADSRCVGQPVGSGDQRIWCGGRIFCRQDSLARFGLGYDSHRDPALGRGAAGPGGCRCRRSGLAGGGVPSGRRRGAGEPWRQVRRPRPRQHQSGAGQQRCGLNRRGYRDRRAAVPRLRQSGCRTGHRLADADPVPDSDLQGFQALAENSIERQLAGGGAATGPHRKRKIQREKWSGRQDLNLRPPVPKTGALPGCATPRRALPLGGAFGKSKGFLRFFFATARKRGKSRLWKEYGGPGGTRTPDLAVMSGQL